MLCLFLSVDLLSLFVLHHKSDRCLSQDKVLGALLGDQVAQWQLNNREQELVPLLLEELTNKEIAYRLNLSINTVKLYMKILMRKLGVSSRAGIISSLLTKKKTTS